MTVAIVIYGVWIFLTAPILLRMEDAYHLPETTTILGACFWPVAGIIALGAWLGDKAAQ